jgi:hypothetical protein
MKISKQLSAVALILTALCLPATVFAAPAGSIDQAKNGSASAPTSPVEWVNGNLGSQNSHYATSYSVPFRVTLSDLSVGAHTVEIEWDIKHSGKHAYDYITDYNRFEPHASLWGHAAETVDPTFGFAGLSAATTFAIPAPSSAGSPVSGQPTTSFNALPATERKMTIWNGTITGLSYVS